jgi:hypothetical protein
MPAATQTAAASPAPTATAASDDPIAAEIANNSADDSAGQKAAATEPAAGAAQQAKSDVQGAANSGNAWIQLGSLKSADAAKQNWAKLQSAFPDQLKALSMRVKTADLGARGTFYRLQAGPVTAAQAKTICQTMDAKSSGSCMVVK